MNETQTRMFDVYLHKRGKRPVKVGELSELDAGVPTFEHEGVTYFNALVDLTRRTVTFVDYRLSPAAVAS